MTSPTNPTPASIEDLVARLLLRHRQAVLYPDDVLVIQELLGEAATALSSAQAEIERLREGFRIADEIACAAIETGFYVGDGLLEKLALARTALNGDHHG